MKASEIKKGGKYVAKVSGVLTTVRVDEIRVAHALTYRKKNNAWGNATVYDVTNLKTGRRTTFRSAAKFRRAADSKPAEVKQVWNEHAYCEMLAGQKLNTDLTPAEVIPPPDPTFSIAEVNARQGREMEQVIGPVPETTAQKIRREINERF